MHQMILGFLPEVLLPLHLGYLASVLGASTDTTFSVDVSLCFTTQIKKYYWAQVSTNALLPLHFRAEMSKKSIIKQKTSIDIIWYFIT